ncbi:MAG TPA: methyltransferase, partial [Bacteroidales bacterium]|nr:methyltransferase [Bacteroidales bacterium]
MSQSGFRFKQFTIIQDKTAMKVGTDGVLLGAWTRPEKAASILDIGTGTGLIALMMAQKSKALITAVEIDKDAADQAQQNTENSPWHERIQVHQSSVQEFSANFGKKFDLIISNPPYFHQSFKNPGIKRSLARHND